jgi:general secretion pathway protein G
MSKTDRSNLYVTVAIVLVLGVMAVLMELLTRRMDTKLRSSPRSLAELQMRQLHYAVEAFRVDVGRLPGQDEGLGALVQAPADAAGRWKGPYLQKGAVPADSWGRPYQYRLDGPRFDVVSLGADGAPGGEGQNEDLSSSKIVANPER